MNEPGISPKQIAVLSVSAGVCVANIYYNQPILADIARDTGSTQQATGYLPVLTQAGYGLGLLLLTPLGDKTDRKRLILLLQAGLAVVLLLVTQVQSLPAFYALSFAIGLFAVATQVIMPMAAALATGNKGKVVGIVFTGALTGILGARIVSGAISEWLGWRWVYGISAGLLLLTGALMAATLPRAPGQYKGHYGALIGSTLYQLVRFSQLRRVVLLGTLVFGSFCSFWTTLTFHLSGPPFHYGSGVIGIFGFLAIGGAAASTVFGRLADRTAPARVQLYTVAMLVASVALIRIFPQSAWAFVVATIGLDVGVQATQVNNLAQVYGLDAAAHSRINTVYMTCMFIGGAFGTWMGVLCWEHGGWPLVSLQLLLWSLGALVVAALGYRAFRRQA